MKRAVWGTQPVTVLYELTAHGKRCRLLSITS
ncbi:hypothetical protein [Chitinophaga sp.]